MSDGDLEGRTGCEEWAVVEGLGKGRGEGDIEVEVGGGDVAEGRGGGGGGEELRVLGAAGAAWGRT